VLQNGSYPTVHVARWYTPEMSGLSNFAIQIQIF